MLYISATGSLPKGIECINIEELLVYSFCEKYSLERQAVVVADNECRVTLHDALVVSTKTTSLHYCDRVTSYWGIVVFRWRARDILEHICRILVAADHHRHHQIIFRVSHNNENKYSNKTTAGGCQRAHMAKRTVAVAAAADLY